MSRTIKMTTDDLNKLLAEAKKFKHFIIYDSDQKHRRRGRVALRRRAN